MTTANSNNRASLLAGLRTGGVRSSSANVPHTAAPAGSFNVPRFPSHHNTTIFPEEEEDDQLAEMPQQNMFNPRNVPMTAAVDGPNNRFSHHQAARGMNPNSIPFSPGFAPNMVPQAQMQMQMLQLEMMRIQVSSLFLPHTPPRMLNLPRRRSRPSSTRQNSLLKLNSSNSFSFNNNSSSSSNNNNFRLKVVRGGPVSISTLLRPLAR